MIAADAPPALVTPAGAGRIALGRSYRALRKEHLIGPLRPGCELAGAGARSARLLAPLRGSVDFTPTAPRRVTTIAILGGATARGVGIGAGTRRVRHAFPAATFDHRTESMFGITLVRVPRSGGGRLQLALDANTGKVTEIGIPAIPFCE